ncbi:MAG: LPS export ABC transporter periplasmic protein LptC [Methylophilaceae bacterium]
MVERSAIFLPLALLALLALLTLWIDRVVQPAKLRPDGSLRHDPDYTMHDFTSARTDIDGNLRNQLAAAEMLHYPDDDSTALIRPRYTLYAKNKPYTQIEGQRGTVSKNGENVQLMDHVKVVRGAFKDRGEMTVSTELLNINVKENIATTDKPVVITQAPKTVIHAIGMIYDKKNGTVQLLQKVRVHYERPEPSRVLPTAKIENNNSEINKRAVNNSPLKPPKYNTRIRRNYAPPAN